MPTFTQHRPGLGSVGQYQMSAQPWISSSFLIPKTGDDPFEITFPRVTQWIYLQNNGSVGIQVGFSSLGTTGSAGGGSNHYFFIPPTDSAYQLPVFRWKVKSLFFLSSDAADDNIVVVAGLTGIHNDLSASGGNNYSGSSGVG